MAKTVASKKKCNINKINVLLYTWALSQDLRGRWTVEYAVHSQKCLTLPSFWIVYGSLGKRLKWILTPSLHSPASSRSNSPVNLSSEKARPPLNSVISDLTCQQVHIIKPRCFVHICMQLCLTWSVSVSLSPHHVLPSTVSLLSSLSMQFARN